MILLITTFSIPLSVFAYSDKVIVGGDNVGIEVNSSGVLVVGYYSINGKGCICLLQVAEYENFVRKRITQLRHRLHVSE